LLEWGAPAERITVLRMGVDVDRFEPPDDGRPLRRPLRALSVGRLVEKKGLRYAIEGAERAAAMVELDIIGYGPLEEELAELANAGANTTRLLGKRAHAEVFRQLANADVFLLPSVVAADGDMEGIPVALMEAMALGVVVIASRHSGVPELIEDGVDGLLVDERSGAQIAAALDRLAAGKVDVAGLRRRARAKVARDFNNAILDRELEALLAGMGSGQVGR
jgi:colanic acid/amylovoran biosynthesis glycosyltransferase